MQSINLSAYYDRISSIRAKILTKHREVPAQPSQKYANESIAYPNSNQNNHKYQPIEGLDIRTPLQQKSSNQQNISERLRQLDTVNEKIKHILANKRQSSVHAQRHSQIAKHSILQSTPKKITSLFQNQNKIVESKVGPTNNNWAVSKQKTVDQKPYRSTIKNTVQSRLFTSQRNEMFKVKQDRTKANKFQDLRQQQASKYQDIPIKNDDQKQDFSKKRSDLTFGEINRQSFDFQKPPNQISQKYIPQARKQIIVSLYSGKQQTKKLVQLLSNQLVLDKKLRESKQDFDSFKAQNKWSKLKQQISSYGIQLKDTQLEMWITISAEESNPFNEKIAQPSFAYSQLATRFVDAWNHWNQKLKDSVQITKLEEQGFKIQQIDLGEKGFITIQDLVCFINLNSDSCLRNRDVFCLFKRWNDCQKGQKVQNKLKYQTFLNFVAQ